MLCVSPFPLVFAEAIHGNVHQHRDEMRNQHFFAPEYGSEYLIPLLFLGKKNWTIFNLNLNMNRKFSIFFQQKKM